MRVDDLKRYWKSDISENSFQFMFNRFLGIRVTRDYADLAFFLFCQKVREPYNVIKMTVT